MSSTCDLMAEDLLAYADGELTGDAGARVDEHVRACLRCRRELAEIAKVNAAVRSLPRLEPSDDFASRLWERLDEMERDTPLRGRGLGRWVVPMLAAAALLVLAVRATLETPPGPGASAPAASSPAAVMAAAPRAPVAHAPSPSGEREEAPVAVAAGAEAPEDLPPELLEHPELFLRLPVVRRLDKLENFEEVRHHEEAEPVGCAPFGDAVG